MSDILYIVIPCYNEEEVIEETVKCLTGKLKALIGQDTISENSRIMLVNDGSKDKTWEIIDRLYIENEFVVGINLSRNKGHQNALIAGLFEAKNYADMIISMDADLQDDINAIDEFVMQYYNGYEIVYGVRKSRKTDSFFKRTTAIGFYKLAKAMGIEMVYNHADYRLMSKRAVESLEEFKEVNLFLRGIIPMIGFKSTTVEYDRGKRFAGKSKYPLKKMIYFAIDGITSTSVRPIRMITMFGLFTLIVSFIFLVYVVYGYFQGGTVHGWATSVILICLFGGAQIMCIGIVGEYVGKIYLETKARPRYIIADKRIK